MNIPTTPVSNPPIHDNIPHATPIVIEGVPIEECQEATELCQRLGIRQLVEDAVALVKRTLRPERIRLEVVGDPEGDSEWCVIRADVRGTVDEVVNAYFACKREWVNLTPLDQLENIRLVYNIL